MKVIPSCAIGAATAGALSRAFGCTRMASYGGIFVAATIGQPFLYILAVLIGSVVGTLLLTLLKSRGYEKEQKAEDSFLII